METAELVHLSVSDRIATVTLDSPHNRNALSRQLLVELAGQVGAAIADPGVRGIVLTHTGGVFCSGADLSDPPRAGDESAVTVPDVLRLLWRCPKATVVELNGHVRAGGLGLVAAADIAVAVTTATFAFTEVRIGVAPAMIAVVCGRRMHPRAVSRYWLTGETFDAATAVDTGLVTMVADDPSAAVASLAAAIRLTEPRAVTVTKGLITDLPAMSVDEGLTHAEAISVELFATDTAAEGIAALRQKRPPSWA
jgi:methylglutaconyl-CoA hydratase